MCVFAPYVRDKEAKVKFQNRFEQNKYTQIYWYYGNTGCGGIKGGIQNQKGFWLKINCIQMKLPTFENWSNGELLKN